MVPTICHAPGGTCLHFRDCNRTGGCTHEPAPDEAVMPDPEPPADHRGTAPPTPALLNLQQSRALEHLRTAVLRARAAGLYLLADSEGQRIVVTTSRAVTSMVAGGPPSVSPRDVQLDGGITR